VPSADSSVAVDSAAFLAAVVSQQQSAHVRQWRAEAHEFEQALACVAAALQRVYCALADKLRLADPHDDALIGYASLSEWLVSPSGAGGTPAKRVRTGPQESGPAREVLQQLSASLRQLYFSFSLRCLDSNQFG
jgi:hypothetical protein